GESFTLPDGSTVTAQGQYDVTLTSSGGCDSIVTTNLTVHPTYDISVDAVICEGDSYTLPDGSEVNSDGNYVITLSTTEGCDSIVTTNLTVTPFLRENIAVSI